MALEEADIAKITEIVNGALDARQAKDTDKNDDKDKDVDAATIKADEAKRRAAESALKSAMAFNINRDGFLESQKSFLPESIQTVIKGMQGRNYKDEIDEANAYRKIIFDEIFGEQKNIDIMPETAKAKIAAYKALADSDKAGKVGDYYELVETYLALKKGMAQSSFNNKGSSASDNYTKKFEQLGEIYTKKGA